MKISQLLIFFLILNLCYSKIINSNKQLRKLEEMKLDMSDISSYTTIENTFTAHGILNFTGNCEPYKNHTIYCVFTQQLPVKEDFEVISNNTSIYYINCTGTRINSHAIYNGSYFSCGYECNDDFCFETVETSDYIKDVINIIEIIIIVFSVFFGVAFIISIVFVVRFFLNKWPFEDNGYEQMLQ